MAKQKSQYQSKPVLEEDLQEHSKEYFSYWMRLWDWMEVLPIGKGNPEVLVSIADLLSRLGFEPDETGKPKGDWPPLMKASPLVFLNYWKATLEVKADILEAATLIWANVYSKENEEFIELYPTYIRDSARWLLDRCDFERFWKRQGVGKTKEGIKNLWEAEERIVTPERLADTLRRAKGEDFSFDLDQKKLERLIRRSEEAKTHPSMEGFWEEEMEYYREKFGRVGT